MKFQTRKTGIFAVFVVTICNKQDSGELQVNYRKKINHFKAQYYCVFNFEFMFDMNSYIRIFLNFPIV